MRDNHPGLLILLWLGRGGHSLPGSPPV
jgi:hypothetical protein